MDAGLFKDAKPGSFDAITAALVRVCQQTV